jgi:hypothetical protein
MDSKPLSVGSLPTNFKISLEARMRAAAGVPAFIRRKRRIEDLEQALLDALDEMFEAELSEHDGDESAAFEALARHAREMDLTLLNDLIDRHNRYYPIEANLPHDVQTGQIMLGGRPWQPLAPLTGDVFLQRWAQNNPDRNGTP